MKTDDELFAYLNRWIAAQPEPPGLKEVLATQDIELFGAHILRGFRIAAAEAVAERDRVERVRRAAVTAFDGDDIKAEEFLRQAHEQLGGFTPLAASVASEEGVLRVMQIMRQRSI